MEFIGGNIISGRIVWRHTCDCCSDLGYEEFKKIVELKDAGVTIYRYTPKELDEAHVVTEAGEVFILRNTGDEDLKIEVLTAKSGKLTISCPRCMKMIDRAKMLFKNLPPDKIGEVTGVCEHCFQKQLIHCPCCDKIVVKFLDFCRDKLKTEEKLKRNKSWLTKTQMSLKKSLTHIKDPKLEHRTNITGQESQTHVSRYTPTKPVQVREPPPSTTYKKQITSEIGPIYEQTEHRPAEQVLVKPLRILSFLDFSQEEKITIKDKSKLDEEREKRLTEKDMEKPLKSISFNSFSELFFSPIPEEKEGFVMSPTLEKQIKSTPITEKYAKYQPMADKELKTTPTVKDDITTEPTVQKGSKPTPFKEKYFKPKLTSERDIERPRTSIMAKDMKPKDTAEKDVKPKWPTTETDIKPKSILKRGGVLKSEKVGDAKDDTTPHGKKKRLHSPATQLSFETIMKSLSEPNVSVFSYTFPHKKILAEHQIKAVSSLELIKNTQDMLDERKEAREEEMKQKIAEQKKIAEDEKIKKEDKVKEIGREKGGKKVGSDEITEDEIYEKGKRKIRDEKGATTALKEGLAKKAKEQAEEEKNSGQKQRDTTLGDKGAARQAEKAIEGTRLQVASDKKTKLSEAKIDSETGLQKSEKAEKVKDKKQHDLGAQAALKEHAAKKANEKSDQEKLKKQQETDAALGEKRAQEAEKALEAAQKQLTAEKKTAPKSETEVKEKAIEKTDGGKGDLGKEDKIDNTDKEQKGKDTKHDDMAAVLREQLLKQKQQELERDKLKKQQEKEKELLEKRLQELERQKEAKETAIKKPVLLLDEDSVDGTVIEDISKSEEVTEIIIGLKILKVKSAKKLDEKTSIMESIQPQKSNQFAREETVKQEPELQKHSKPLQGLAGQNPAQPAAESTPQKREAIREKTSKPNNESDPNKGVIRYTLSDRTFIEKGWTMLPTEKVVRKMNVYRMRPAKPQFDWFENNKNKQEMNYDSGERLAEFDDNGRGRWYYRSGELALDYYDAEETNAGQRFVVYSTGQPDERGRSRPRTLLATFDYSGNGIVFDHTGKIRLKYNQTEGVVLDRTVGPVSHWKWHTLNDPPVLQQVMIDTQMPYKDPTILKMGDKNADAKRPDNEEMLAIEFENFLKEKRQKLTQSFKPFQIRMKAMKINEYFSLRVLDQASIYLIFRDGATNLKLNIGMVLDHKEIVDTDTAEIGEVSNTLDKLPACTDSIAGLQKAVAKAQAQERSRVRHELRLKPPVKAASEDALRDGCSRPLRTPVVQASISSCDKMTPKRFKPSCCNLYYSTQIL